MWVRAVVVMWIYLHVWAGWCHIDVHCSCYKFTVSKLNRANGFSHIALSCGNKTEQCLFVWSKVIVYCSREQVWNVWILLCKLVLNCNLVLFSWKWINSKSWMSGQWGSQLLAVKVCCFSWMRQQLLWDFFGTPTASQVIWYTFTCKIKNILLVLKLMNACCNYCNLRNTVLFHLGFDEHSMTPPAL